MVGAVFQAAHERRVVVVDGFIASAAVLVAHALQPLVLQRCVLHTARVNVVTRPCCSTWGCRRCWTWGCAWAKDRVRPWLGRCQSACALLREMASFGSAGCCAKHAGASQPDAAPPPSVPQRTAARSLSWRRAAVPSPLPDCGAIFHSHSITGALARWVVQPGHAACQCGAFSGGGLFGGGAGGGCERCAVVGFARTPFMRRWWWRRWVRAGRLADRCLPARTAWLTWPTAWAAACDRGAGATDHHGRTRAWARLARLPSGMALLAKVALVAELAAPGQRQRRC